MDEESVQSQAWNKAERRRPDGKWDSTHRVSLRCVIIRAPSSKSDVKEKKSFWSRRRPLKFEMQTFLMFQVQQSCLPFDTYQELKKQCHLEKLKLFICFTDESGSIYRPTSNVIEPAIGKLPSFLYHWDIFWFLEPSVDSSMSTTTLVSTSIGVSLRFLRIVLSVTFSAWSKLTWRLIGF